MPQYFQKPETALKRARELQRVEKPAMALETLHSLITNRRHRTWSRTHEDIMKLYIDLCIELQKGRMARDGLHQYKNITGLTAVGSLQTIIDYYIDQAETKVKAAKAELDDKTVDAEDLDAIESPESVLLAAVSEEGTADRTGRSMFTPLLKFLWESYRTVLDILRNNAKLEMVYQRTAIRAFKFCLEYERKPEFRRLCELLRQHLQQIAKYQNQTNAVNLDNPDSIEAHLKTRFEQLSVAGQLELWQEAFKAVEDISNLMAKKSPKASVMSTYYRKLAAVFWKSDDFIFHALAHQKYLLLNRDNKKKTADDVQDMASAVMLATLAIPVKPIDNEAKTHALEHIPEKAVRLSLLVRVTTVPTREELLNELVSTNTLAVAAPELEELYSLLETDFNPLQLCKKVAPILEKVEANPKLAQYSPRIKRVAMMRLLKQLSRVYTSLRFQRICDLIPFATEFEIEKFLVQAVRAGLLQLRICHRTRSVSFTTNVFVPPKEDSSEGGPTLELLHTDSMQGQLTTLSKRLGTALAMIDPTARKLAAEKRTSSVVKNAITRISQEHEAILERKKIIEDRKEHIETETRNRLRNQAQAAQREYEEAKQKEAERLATEALERERRRAQRERDEIQKQQVMQRIESLRQNAAFKDLFKDVTEEDLKNLDADQIMQKQVEQLEKDKREQTQKQRTVEKRVDYLERAKRLVEIPYLEEYFKNQKSENEKLHQEQQKVKRDQSERDHTKALETKTRLLRMVDAKAAYSSRIINARRKQFDQQMSEFKEAMRRQELHRQEMEEEARRREEQAKIDEENRLREEAERAEQARIAAEEAAKRKAEEDARRKEEAEKRRAELDAAAERQRQKEAEIEARMEAERKERAAAASGPPGRDGPDDWRRGGAGPGRGGPPGRVVDLPRDPRSGPPEGRDDFRRPGGYERGPPARGARDEWRRSDAPPPGRDAPPPGRDEWRRGGPGPSRDGPPPRDGGSARGARDEWRRGDAPPSRGPAGGGGDEWRRGDAPPPRDDARGQRPGMGADRGPPARDEWRRGDAAPPARGPPASGPRDTWRRGDAAPPGRDGPPPARSGGRDEWRRGDAAPPARGGPDSGPPSRAGGRDEWRRGGAGDAGPPQRGGARSGGDEWRRGGAPPAGGEPRKPAGGAGGDWQEVRTGKR